MVNVHKRISNSECEVCGRKYYVRPSRKPRHQTCAGNCRSVIAKKYPEAYPTPGGWNKGFDQLSPKMRKKVNAALRLAKLTDDGRRRMSEKHKGNQYWKLVKHRQKGPEAYNWKGGTSSWKKIIYDSPEYKRWRKAVFERDNYTCKHCGARSAKEKGVWLEADHIKPFAYFPELRFTLSNGRTLCRECHKKTDTFGIKAKINYESNLNRK